MDCGEQSLEDPVSHRLVGTMPADASHPAHLDLQANTVLRRFARMLGTGIIKGLVETARNFVGSYTDEARLVTIEYPEQRVPPMENTRQFPFLVFDGEDPAKGLRCVACQICEKECPPQCIYIEKSSTKKPDYLGKAQFFPKVFDLDLSVCMSCQICVEVCPFDAIKMDTAFELSNADRFGGLLVHKVQLAKPNTFYSQIHPTEAAEVDARLLEAKEKAAAKAKADAEVRAKAAATAAALKQPVHAPTSPTEGAPAGPPAKPAQPICDAARKR